MTNNFVLEFKSFHSPDVEDLLTWEPSSPRDVCYWLEFELGEPKKEESFVFGVTIATKEGFNDSQDKYPNAFFQPVLYVENYSWRKTMVELQNILRQQKYGSWVEAIDVLKDKFAFEHR